AVWFDYNKMEAHKGGMLAKLRAGENGFLVYRFEGCDEKETELANALLADKEEGARAQKRSAEAAAKALARAQAKEAKAEAGAHQGARRRPAAAAAPEAAFKRPAAVAGAPGEAAAPEAAPAAPAAREPALVAEAMAAAPHDPAAVPSAPGRYYVHYYKRPRHRAGVVLRATKKEIATVGGSGCKASEECLRDLCKKCAELMEQGVVEEGAAKDWLASKLSEELG
ncbi:unnamed protein product, partial [Prorocentrum cordatum]